MSARAPLRPMGSDPLTTFEASRLKALAPDLDRISFELKTAVWPGAEKDTLRGLPDRVRLVLEAIEEELK